MLNHKPNILLFQNKINQAILKLIGYKKYFLEIILRSCLCVYNSGYIKILFIAHIYYSKKKPVT